MPKPLRQPRTGTDFRDDESKKYQWPHPFYQRPGETVEQFWSVTGVLECLESFGRVREIWIVKHVRELVALAKQQKTYERWDDAIKKMVDAKPIDLLDDREWLENAGWRELNRAAARGTVVHDAIEEWVYNNQEEKPQVAYEDDNSLYAYTIELIQYEKMRRGSFFVDPDPLYLYIRQALKWLDDHVKTVHMAETMVCNRTLGYAGTVDLDVELKHADGLWRIDAKTSASHYDSHRIQLAAYYHAEFAALQHQNVLEPLPVPDHTANLYIGTDGATLREWWTDKKGVVIPAEREKDMLAFTSLLVATMPRVKRQLGEDGRYHAINPVTVKACTNRSAKDSGLSVNEPDYDNPNESMAVRSIK